MKRSLVRTEDGSPTLYIEALDEHYHSIYGALQESLHVFIEAGLKPLLQQPSIALLEVGLGTGLNALLTMKEADHYEGHIHYTALEAYPLLPQEWAVLDYSGLLGEDNTTARFEAIHRAPAEESVELAPHFHFTRKHLKLEVYSPLPESFDLIYFDAFAPDAQPELWTQEVFSKLCESLKPGGVLVTYCAKGYVKRNLKAAGFRLEALPGPKNKREMTRASKP